MPVWDSSGESRFDPRTMLKTTRESGGTMAVTPMNAKGEAVTSARPREPAAGVAVDAERRSRLIDLGEPATRPLKAFAFDPSQGTNQMQLSVRYEQLDPGPV